MQAREARSHSQESSANGEYVACSSPLGNRLASRSLADLTLKPAHSALSGSAYFGAFGVRCPP